LNDCWPAISKSGMDHYGKWKALHYFARKAFAPLLVSIDGQGDTVKVYVISDLRTPEEAELEIKLTDFEGEEYFKKIISLTIPANSSQAYFSIPKNQLLQHLKEEEVVFKTTLTAQEDIITENQLYFVPFKALSLKKPGIQFFINPSENGYALNFITNVLAKTVYLRFEDDEGFFSDNYFDLFPGEEKIINLRTSKTISELRDQLLITSVYDSYQ